MNEIVRYILVFIFGCLFTLFAGWFIIVGPSQQRIRQLTTELNSAQSDNTRLTESAQLRQHYINKAKDIIGSSIDSISKLRGILKTLQDYDNSSDPHYNR